MKFSGGNRPCGAGRVRIEERREIVNWVTQETRSIFYVRCSLGFNAGPYDSYRLARRVRRAHKYGRPLPAFTFADWHRGLGQWK